MSKAPYGHLGRSVAPFYGSHIAAARGLREMIRHIE
jgi:hypothetical protein